MAVNERVREIAGARVDPTSHISVLRISVLRISVLRISVIRIAVLRIAALQPKILISDDFSKSISNRGTTCVSGRCASVTARCGKGLAGDTQKVMPALFTHLSF